MEDALDEIARGEAARVPWLRRFYFGADGEEGLKELVSDLSDIDARDVSSFPLAGTDIVVRVGRYGPYLERGRAAGERARGHRPGRAHPGAGRGAVRPAQRRRRRSAPTRRPGRTIVAKAGRFGPYVTEVLRRRAPTRQAAHRVAAEVHGAGHGHAGGRAAAAHPAADRSASWTASRSPCRTAGTGPT